MQKILLVIAILLAATPALAARSDSWHVSIRENYRNNYGRNELKVNIRLAKSSGGSSLLGGEICGRPAKGRAVCTNIEGGRMRQGDSVSMWVTLPNTEYPIQSAYLRN